MRFRKLSAFNALPASLANTQTGTPSHPRRSVSLFCSVKCALSSRSTRRS